MVHGCVATMETKSGFPVKDWVKRSSVWLPLDEFWPSAVSLSNNNLENDTDSDGQFHRISWSVQISRCYEVDLTGKGGGS